MLVDNGLSSRRCRGSLSAIAETVALLSAMIDGRQIVNVDRRSEDEEEDEAELKSGSISLHFHFKLIR